MYSNIVAWDESYILRSYINLYDLTKNTTWLDKFTTHAGTIIANADDIDVVMLTQ